MNSWYFKCTAKYTIAVKRSNGRSCVIFCETNIT